MTGSRAKKRGNPKKATKHYLRSQRANEVLEIEALELRIVLAGNGDSDQILFNDFVFPTGGFDVSTYSGHLQAHAVDINQDLGSTTDNRAPVFAAHEGIARINSSSTTVEYGRSVKLTALNGQFSTLYAHLDEFLINTPNRYPVWEYGSAGEPLAWFVRQGDLLGLVGTTGNSNNDHLHFELRDSNGASLSFNAAPSQLNDLVPFRFTKGFFRTLPRNTISEGTIEFVSSGEQHSFNVAMVRPNDELFVNTKGFGWNEEVRVRIVNESGTQIFEFPDAVSKTEIQNDDDLLEDMTADLSPFWNPASSGLFFVEGIEQDRASYEGIAYFEPIPNSNPVTYARKTAGDKPFPWNRTGFATQTSELDVVARPMAIVSSKAAPRSDFDQIVQNRKSTDQPWQIVDTTLVIAGSTEGAGYLSSNREVDDHISISKDGNFWVLEHAAIDGVWRFALNAFDSIYVDAGGGNDVIDLRDVDLPISVFGRAGNDVIMGGADDDILVGGDGLDWIEGGPGRDWILGGAGDDVLFGDDVLLPTGTQGQSDRDYVFGESGNDSLFVRLGDNYHGGDGVDWISNSVYGWQWSDVPTEIGGRAIFSENVRSLSISHVGQNLLLCTPVRTVSFIEAAFNNNSISEVLVFGSSLSDVIDLFPSFVRSSVFGRGGNDTITGSNFSDRIFGGSGSNQLLGRGGADFLYAGAGGANIANGNGGDDSIFGSGFGDALTGEVGRDYFVKGGLSDSITDASALDIVGRVVRRRQERLDALHGGATIADRESTAGQRVSTSAPGISEFSIDNNVVTRGDGFVVTVRTDRIGSWARMTLYADQNNNGRFDASTDIQLLTTRGRTIDFRGHVRTSELAPGVYNIRAKLEAYDGSVSQSCPLSLTIVQGQPTPPQLPTLLAFQFNDPLLIIPHKNGDAFVPGNSIGGPGQIDLYELTIGTSGNHGFSTTGLETVRAIYDSNGNRIGEPSVGNSALIVDLTEGLKYILAVSARFPETGGYDLVITGRNQISNGDIDTPPGNYVGSTSGTFATGNTIDYWKIVAPTTATLLDVYVDATAGLDLWVRVADTTNTVIGFANLGQPGSPEVLTNLPVNPGTTYYITLHGLFGTAGDYNLTADFYQDDIGLPSTIDPATALADYKPLIVHADGDYSLPNQSLNAAGEFKYFLITPTNSGQFILRTTGNTDTQIGFYTGAGDQLLAFSDDDAGDLNGQVQVDLEGGTEYWLVVRGKENATGPFGVQVFGPDQSQEPLLVGGLGVKGSDTFFLGITSNRQKYYSVTAPSGTTTMTMIAEVLDPSTQPMDLWVSVEDSEGNITVVDASGVNGIESLTNFIVMGGETYRITLTSKNRASGPGKLSLDFSPDSNGSGEFVVNSVVSNHQLRPRVSMNAAGRSVVVWTRTPPAGSSGGDLDDDIYFQIFDEGGIPVGTEQRANVNDSFVYQDNADVAIASNGEFVISWNDLNSLQVRFRVFDSNGNPLTGEIDSGFTNVYRAKIAAKASDSFMLIGETGNQIVIRSFSLTGTPTIPVTIVDDPPGNNDVYGVAIAAGQGGEYIASWTRQGAFFNVIAQRLDLAGNKVGSEVVAAPSSLLQDESSISANANGQFVVALRQVDNDGTAANIYVAAFSSNNQLISPVSRAHSNVLGEQDQPTVLMKSDGSFVVAWTNPDVDGSEKGVSFRQFDSLARPYNSDETLLNEFVTGAQERPVLAGNQYDTFFPVWESYSQDGSGDSIVGHRILLPTPTPAPIITITESVGLPNDSQIPFDRFALGSAQPSHTFRIQNTGNAVLAGQMDFSGSHPGFVLQGNSSILLQPGEFRDVAVEMLTSAIGFFEDELVIQHNASISPPTLQIAGVVGPLADIFEPNDSDETATELGVISTLSLSNLTQHADGDSDWYRFEVGAYSKVDISAMFLHDEGNIDLVVYDNNLGILAVGGSIADNESVYVYLDVGQTAFVKIAANGPAINTYSLSLVATETNRPPLFDNQYLDVLESAAGGTSIGTVIANDPDPNQTLTYAIAGGTGIGLFEIDSNSGEITLVPGASLDFENAQYYTLDLEVTDSGIPTLSDTALLTISVVDENEGPTDIDLSANTLAENVSGAIIGLVTVTDPDIGDVHTLEVSDNRFEVIDGQLKLKPGQSLDFETTPSMILDFTARDIGGLEFVKSFTINITDEDDTPSIAITDASVTEGGTLSFLVTLSYPSSQTTTVNYLTADGSAIAGSDYTASSGTLTFSPGETTKSISVASFNDTLDELHETFVVNLSGVSNALIGDGQGVGTIQDNDPAPSVSISDVTSNEGLSGTTEFTFNVMLSAASGRTVKVNYATADGTATIADNDYQSGSGTVTFSPGQTVKTVTILVNGDATNELNETFLVNLSGATACVIGDGQAVGTIVDIELPSVLIADASVVEGGTVLFTVTLSASSSQTITVNYGTADGSATAGSDYTSSSGTLTFSPGETTKSFAVASFNDALDELHETFVINLSGVSNALLGDSQGVGTIQDNDPAPSVSIGDVTSNEGQGGTTAFSFTVTLSAASGRTVKVNYATADGTATIADNDYQTGSGTLTFSPGQTAKTITVLVNGDVTVEPNETLLINLTGPTACVIGDGQGVGTIVDDDGMFLTIGALGGTGTNPFSYGDGPIYSLHDSGPGNRSLASPTRSGLASRSTREPRLTIDDSVDAKRTDPTDATAYDFADSIESGIRDPRATVRSRN